MTSVTTAVQSPPRWAIAAAVAILTCAFTAARVLHEPQWPTDFDQLWHAANALLDGTDPYAVVGPGRTFEWNWPLYYPLPAVLYAVPFAFLPIEAARIVFSTVAAGLLGWAAAPRWRTHWPMLLSASYLIAASRNQWAPLFLAAAWVPSIAFLTPAKPNVGLATLASMSGRRLGIALTGCTVVVALCFLVRPDWFGSWRKAIVTAPHVQAALLTFPFGPLLAIAALRWKRPDARLFLALVAVPHTPSLYDLLLLFFVCRTLRETLVLALLSQAVYWGTVTFASYSTFDLYAEGLGRMVIFLVYAPVLLLILSRPNREVDPETKGAGTAERVPSNWIDAGLLSLLIIAATMLIWLPLVTYR